MKSAANAPGCCVVIEYDACSKGDGLSCIVIAELVRMALAYLKSPASAPDLNIGTLSHGTN